MTAQEMAETYLSEITRWVEGHSYDEAFVKRVEEKAGITGPEDHRRFVIAMWCNRKLWNKPFDSYTAVPQLKKAFDELVAENWQPDTPVRKFPPIVNAYMTLDIFSGRPNPTQVMSEEETKRFEEQIKDAVRLGEKFKTKQELHLGMGYRGVVVEMPDCTKYRFVLGKIVVDDKLSDAVPDVRKIEIQLLAHWVAFLAVEKAAT